MSYAIKISFNDEASLKLVLDAETTEDGATPRIEDCSNKTLEHLLRVLAGNLRLRRFGCLANGSEDFNSCTWNDLKYAIAQLGEPWHWEIEEEPPEGIDEASQKLIL